MGVATAATEATEQREPPSRNQLEKLRTAGYAVSLSTTWDLSRLPSNAGSRRGVARGLFDTSVEMDLDRIAGLRRTSAFAQFLWKTGPNGSDYLGDLQGFSNIDNEPFGGLYELWIQTTLVDERIRLKGGRIDANTEFASVDAASQFLNSSMGFSPTIVHMSTYPSPAMSMNVFAELHPRFTLGGGLYSDEEGTGSRWQHPFAIAEAGSSWSPRALEGRVKVGGWRKRDADDADVEHGSYVVVEQALWPVIEGGARLSSFFQWGSSVSSACGFDRHIGGGLIWQGFMANRPDDAIGFGVSRVRASVLSETPGAREVVFATYARIGVTPWIALTPDVQVVKSGRSSSDSVRVVGTLRFTAGF